MGAIKPVAAALCAAVLALWLPSASASNRLLGLRLAHDTDQLWRVVLDCAEAPRYRHSKLNAPTRLIIDLADTQLPKRLPLPSLHSSPIADLRLSQRDDGGLRLVVELSRSALPRLLTLAPGSGRGHRLMLVLNTSAGALQSLAPGDVGASEVVVVIDAGHGGRDPGAVSASGLREKTVALSVAKKLQRRLNAEPGFAALLSRREDRLVDLVARRRFAREHRASLMLSVHADSIPSGYGWARGAAVYMLSDKEASSREGYFLSQRENKSPQLDGLPLAEQTEDVRSVLYDLSLNASRQRAAVMAEPILRALSKVTRLHKKQVEQANFVVLRAPDVPSLLIELGFLSNLREARRLATAEYQNLMVEALFTGVRDFFASHPPEGSWLAWRRLNIGMRHTVQPGESVWLLARRYGTSIEAIVRHNGLGADADKLQVGQSLLIPAAQAVPKR